MESNRQTTRAGDDLLHGTSPLKAIGIELEGFRLSPAVDRFWGRGALGDGIYVTHSVVWAREFMRDFAGSGRGVVIRVTLAPGTRLLWLNGEFDPRRIDSLRREFGAELLHSAFHKALPSNKHLNRRELIDLLNFLHARARVPIWRHGWAGVSGVRAQLRRAKYAGFGCATSDVGIVIFDPALLRVARIDRFDEGNRLIPAPPSWLLEAATTQVTEFERDYQEMVDDPRGEGVWYEVGEPHATRTELERLRGQLATFARRHGH